MYSEEHPRHSPDQGEEDFVRALAPVMLMVVRAVDVDMTRGAGLQLSEYTALLNLSEAPGRLLRMSDLAAACGLSLSGMTSILSRLEKQGLAVRVRSAEDGRGWNAVLTDSGLSRLEQAWPTLLTSLRRNLLDHMSGHDFPQLTATLKLVAADRTARSRPLPIIR